MSTRSALAPLCATLTTVGVLAGALLLSAPSPPSPPSPPTRPDDRGAPVLVSGRSFVDRAGLIDSQFLKDKRRYALVVVFVIAAVLTPPDVISQFALAVPTLLLYEASILSVRMVERKRAEAEAARAAEE